MFDFRLLTRLQSKARGDPKPQRLFCFRFLLCAFSSVSSNCPPERMHNHINCICSIFLHCVFSNVSSNRLPEQMQSCIGCICLNFLHCVFNICLILGDPEMSICLDFIPCVLDLHMFDFGGFGESGDEHRGFWVGNCRPLCL